MRTLDTWMQAVIIVGIGFLILWLAGCESPVTATLQDVVVDTTEYSAQIDYLDLVGTWSFTDKLLHDTVPTYCEITYHHDSTFSASWGYIDASWRNSVDGWVFISGDTLRYTYEYLGYAKGVFVAHISNYALDVSCIEGHNWVPRDGNRQRRFYAGRGAK